MTDKKSLRKQFSALRKTLKNEVSDSAITARLLSLNEIASADTVLLYASFGSEINTWELAEKLVWLGKITAFPRCGENGSMTFHCVSELSQLRNGTAGKYGICEPYAELHEPPLSAKTVCIVPGLAFTPDGGRLGYGGGYYDRFLAGFPKICRIALAYEGMLTNELPLMSHDLKVDIIVTEERTVLCK